MCGGRCCQAFAQASYCVGEQVPNCFLHDPVVVWVTGGL